MKVTILGLGNILLGDEGFGVHFVRWFEERHRLPAGVAVVDGGTLGYVLLDTICACERLIVVDCLKLADTPGSLYRFGREELEAHLPPPTSMHEVKFAEVLCKAELMGELPEMVFIGIVPERCGEMELELTGTVRARLPEVERLVLNELARWGVTPPAGEGALA